LTDAPTSTAPGFVRKTVGEAVAAQLRGEIQRGLLVPGQRVRQREIAARLGVSTTPVREALHILQAERLVVVEAHRGAVIAGPSSADLAELYEVREALERLAMGLAVPHLKNRDLARLVRLQEKMRKSNDPREWAPLNSEFHMVIYRGCGRELLLTLIGQLRDRCSLYIEGMHSLLGEREETLGQHDEILAACRAGDIRRAQDAITEHLRHTADVMLRPVE